MAYRAHGFLCLIMVAGLGGCAASNGHQQNVDAADARYHCVRAQLMMPLAKQQFETGDLEQSQRTAQEALRIDPAHAGFHVLLGRIAIEEGRLERGLNFLRRAIELDPKAPEAHYYSGLVFQRWRKKQDAYDSYLAAYQLEPDRPTFLLAVAQLLLQMEREDEAIALLTSKLDYFEHSAGIRLALGQLHALRGDTEQAITCLDEAHLLQPDDASILEELALTELAAGHHDSAARHLEQVQAMPGAGRRADLERALAAAHQGAGRTGAAREAYARLTRADGSDDDAWMNLAEIAWSDGDLPTALQAAQRVMALAPQRPDAYLLAGMVWQRNGRLDKSLELFDRAARVAPDSARPVLLRGLALERSGRTHEAADAYREALRREPGDQRVSELLARVEAAP